MPIKRRPALRSPKPVIFFRGSYLQASNIFPDYIHELFREAAHVEVPEDIETKRKYRLFRERILLHMAHLERIYGKSGQNSHHSIILAESPVGVIPLKINFSPKRQIFTVMHYPASHGVTANPDESAFDKLKKILTEGFRGTPDTPSNVFLQHSRRRSSEFATEARESHIFGDSYTIEMVAAHSNVKQELVEKGRSHILLTPNQSILRVNIHLHPELSESQVHQRQLFYRDALKGIPLSFIPKSAES